MKLFSSRLFRFGLFFMVFGLFALLEWKFSRIRPWQIPKVLSNMRAKEFCTCYFILNKDKNACLKKVEMGMPLFHFDIQESSVEFKNPVASSKAFVHNDLYGCVVE